MERHRQRKVIGVKWRERGKGREKDRDLRERVERWKTDGGRN